MIKSVETIFKCDHCNKISRSAGAMSRHEKYCNKNPEFHHPCFFCSHLETEQVHIPLYVNYNDGTEEAPCLRTSTEFYCKKREIYLHPKKAELTEIGEIAENFGELMPLECEDKCFDNIPDFLKDKINIYDNNR